MSNGMSEARSWAESLHAPAGPPQGTLRVPMTSAMCDGAGLLRFDSLARLAEMISVASGESGLRGPALSWVVRTTLAEVRQYPAVGDWVNLTISTSGWGPAWIERRIVVELDPASDGERSFGPAIVVSTVWVSFDRDARRPSRLQGEELDRWRTLANGRRIGAAHVLNPLDGSVTPTITEWPLRKSDIDIQGHLNNAAALSPFDDRLAAEGLTGRRGFYRVEYGSEIDPTDTIFVESTQGDSGLDGQLRKAGNRETPAVIFAARFT